MKVPSSWLEKYVKLTKSPEEISELLTIAGLEVEKIDFYKMQFKGVVIGHVEAVKPHPQADKLQIATVHDGTESFEVVCGAPNCRENINVAFAKVGSELILTNGESLKISKRDLRGVTSYGMLCSEAELDLSRENAGIMIFPEDAPVGEDLVSFLQDPTFDIALTPNLGYCRSIIGVAREIGTQIREKVSLPEVALKESEDIPVTGKIEVTNEAPEDCLQFTCRVVQGVEIGPSPAWLREWLTKAGYQSINNIVDVTNFVMHELGQPLHAFDYDKLEHKKIIVRNAGEEETLKTLDGVERKIPQGAVLICDDDTPIAIGGVMGGDYTAVSDSTHTILLEAAQFAHMSIRKTSKQLSLRTEASSRFEYEVDADGVIFALNRAAALIAEVAGGRVCKGVIEKSSLPFRPRFVTCRLSKANKLLGTKFSLSEMEALLEQMEFTITSDGLDVFQIKVPSFRNDITDEIDIIEELARAYGYNKIERTPPKHVTSNVAHHPLYLLEKVVRQKLVSVGLQEFLTCSLLSPKVIEMEMDHNEDSRDFIHVLHAKSVDQSVLRPSVLPGLLSSVKLNQNQSRHDIQAFEIGRVQFKTEEGYDEKSVLGILMTGKTKPSNWSEKSRDVDFFDLKGILENLSQMLLLPKVEFERSDFSTFHPGRQCALHINSEVFGVMGEIHPDTLRKLDIRGRALFAELDMHQLERLRPNLASFSQLPQFPSSERDLTLTMKKKVQMQPLFNALERVASPLLKRSELLDIYTDESIGHDKMNVTFRFTYRDDNRTLEDEEIQKEHDKIVKALSKAT